MKMSVRAVTAVFLAAATLVATGINSAAEAVTVKATFTSAQQITNVEVQQKCQIPNLGGIGSANSAPNSLSGGADYNATVTFDGTSKVTVDDDYSGDPDQFQDLTAAGGFEAVLVKVSNFYYLYCFKNATSVELLIDQARNNANLTFIAVYWGDGLCPSTSLKVQAICGDVPETVTGFIFNSIAGSSTEQLACGCNTVFLRCDAHGGAGNTPCIPTGSTFSSTPSQSQATVTLPEPASPVAGAAVTQAISQEQFVTQYCSSQSGGNNTVLEACMAQFGF